MSGAEPQEEFVNVEEKTQEEALRITDPLHRLAHLKASVFQSPAASAEMDCPTAHVQDNNLGPSRKGLRDSDKPAPLFIFKTARFSRLSLSPQTIFHVLAESV